MLLPLPAFGADDSFATGGFLCARAEDANAPVGCGVDFTSPPMVTAGGSACAESFGSKGSAAALGCSLLCFRLCFSHCCSPREKKSQWPEPDHVDSLGLGFCPASPTKACSMSLQNPAPGLAASASPGGDVQRRALVMLLGDIPASPQARGLPCCVCHPVAALTVIFPREHQLLPVLPLLQMRR